MEILGLEKILRVLVQPGAEDGGDSLFAGPEVLCPHQNEERSIHTFETAGLTPVGCWQNLCKYAETWDQRWGCCPGRRPLDALPAYPGCLLDGPHHAGLISITVDAFFTRVSIGLYWLCGHLVLLQADEVENCQSTPINLPCGILNGTPGKYPDTSVLRFEPMSAVSGKTFAAGFPKARVPVNHISTQ